LVTGGAGFLGSHLCDRFIKEGHHVIAMDNLITGDLKNIEHLMPLEQFEFYHHDVSKFIHIPGELDYILHFASPASPIDYLKIPIPTLKVGSLGTHNCLGLALAKNARMLIASTSEVYGDPMVHPQNEDYWGNVNPVGPRGVYDEAKRFQEAMTMAYHTFHGVETRIIRIFNTYGPRMRLNDGRALPAFIGQALRGEDITVFGDGSQTRSFCYVDDLVEGIHRLLLSDYVHPVNIGNPDEISILDFAKEIIALTGTDQKIVLKDLPMDDPKQRKPDITRAKEILDWEPKIKEMPSESFPAKTAEFKSKIQKGTALEDLIPEAFACVREAARRTLGERHYDVQLMGGIILHQGKIAEMKTGEGKTLVSTLPVYLNALTDKGVHVVTVNDYLAKRDAVWMGQNYAMLGLTVGVLNHDVSYLYDPGF